MLINQPDTEFNTANNEFTRKLCDTMAKFDSLNTSQGNSHTLPKPYMPKDLMSCEQVWLRVDRIRKPLEAPYTGPFTVQERTPKYFVLEKNKDVHVRVSVDRLKPFIKAFKDKNISNNNNTDKNISNDNNKIPIENTPSCSSEIATGKTKRTSSGRRVTWKKDPSYHYF